MTGRPVRGRRVVTTGAILGLTVTLALPAAAGTPTPVAPAPDTVYSVEQLTFPVEPLTFGSANADGSVTDDGAKQLTLLSDVFFDYNSAKLNANATQALATVSARLRASNATTVTVTGHTDSDGDDASNQSLSEKRAQAVKAALAPALPGVNITANGRGEKAPVTDNGSDAAKAKNRRVTITITG